VIAYHALEFMQTLMKSCSYNFQSGTSVDCLVICI